MKRKIIVEKVIGFISISLALVVVGVLGVRAINAHDTVVEIETVTEEIIVEATTEFVLPDVYKIKRPTTEKIVKVEKEEIETTIEETTEFLTVAVVYKDKDTSGGELLGKVEKRAVEKKEKATEPSEKPNETNVVAEKDGQEEKNVYYEHTTNANAPKHGDTRVNENGEVETYNKYLGWGVRVAGNNGDTVDAGSDEIPDNVIQ